MYTSVPCGAPGCSNDGDVLSSSGSEYVGETGENGGVIGEGDLIMGPWFALLSASANTGGWLADCSEIAGAEMMGVLDDD